MVTEVPVSNSLTWESPSLEKGLKVEGIVDSVSDFGVFIKMKDSKVGDDPNVEARAQDC